MNLAKSISRNLSRIATRGFSLIELMVALVAGLLVSGAVVTFTMSSFKANSDYVQSTRLTQELRNTLDLVTRDLKRAGYDDDALRHLAAGTTSVFAPVFVKDTGSTVTPGSSATFANADTDGCVLYGYDRTGGSAGVPDLNRGEIRGLRRITETIDGRTVGVIEYSESASGLRPLCTGEHANYTTYPASCNTAGSTGSHWCPLSDAAKLNITEFRIVNNRIAVGTAPSQIQVRNLSIILQGQLIGSTEFTRGVTSSVKINSDCFKPAVASCNNSP